VAAANVRAARVALPPAGRLDDRAFNIGTSVATSVLQLAAAAQRAAGTALAVEHAPARPGEQLRSFVNNDKAKQVLGWTPQATLERGLAETFAWFRQRHQA
jgi:UDP-glucose 4-epimerase